MRHLSVLGSFFRTSPLVTCILASATAIGLLDLLIWHGWASGINLGMGAWADFAANHVEGFVWAFGLPGAAALCYGAKTDNPKALMLLGALVAVVVETVAMYWGGIGWVIGIPIGLAFMLILAFTAS